ncbi:MAG TPA: DUF5989 family protein [Chthonomonadales bacterium]|nr:DUF5989 family protein [Chthonomonadales bacterium]
MVWRSGAPGADAASLDAARGSPMGWLGNRIAIVGELFGFLRRRKLWWLIPMMAVVIVFGTLVALAGSSPAAPFIYTLF